MLLVPDDIPVLNGDLDGQYWLPAPFKFLLMRPLYNKKSKDKNTPLKRNSEYFKIKENDRILCHHIPDQLYLPFSERRKLSKRDARYMINNNWPNFERKPCGNIVQVLFKKSNTNDLEQWCYENCLGLYYIMRDPTGYYAVFEKIHDATLAKLFCS